MPCEIRPIAVDTPQHRFFKGDTFSLFLICSIILKLIFYDENLYFNKKVSPLSVRGVATDSGEKLEDEAPNVPYKRPNS